MFDCIVVGGGIIGMLTARQLRIQGMKVLLLDRSATGTESSWAGGGILSPLYPWRYPEPVSELAAWSHRNYEQLAEALHQESGIDPEWTRSGLLMPACDEIEQAMQWAHRYNANLQQIHGIQQIRMLETGLALEVNDALWMPEVAQIRNPRLVQALKGSLEHYGVEIAEHEEVTSLETDADRVTHVVTDKRKISAQTIVLCAGAWTAGILKSAGLEVKVEPVRGQMLVFKARPGIIQHIILYEGRYLIPRRDGRVLMGSTMEYVGFDKATTEMARAELQEKALEIVPELARYPIEKHWAGLRPGSPTGIPYIGKHNKYNNLYFNAGHFRNGVIIGPASVHVLCSQILGQTADIDPTRFGLMAAH